MFINKQSFFTTIDKDIKFFVLAQIANRIKEEFYKALGVVIIHYKKAGFDAKLVECDG